MPEAAARACIAALTHDEKVQLLALLNWTQGCADLRTLQEPAGK